MGQELFTKEWISYIFPYIRACKIVYKVFIEHKIKVDFTLNRIFIFTTEKKILLFDFFKWSKILKDLIKSKKKKCTNTTGKLYKHYTGNLNKHFWKKKEKKSFLNINILFCKIFLKIKSKKILEKCSLFKNYSKEK